MVVVVEVVLLPPDPQADTLRATAMAAAAIVRVMGSRVRLICGGPQPSWMLTSSRPTQSFWWRRRFQLWRIEIGKPLVAVAP